MHENNCTCLVPNEDLALAVIEGGPEGFTDLVFDHMTKALKYLATGDVDSAEDSYTCGHVWDLLAMHQSLSAMVAAANELGIAGVRLPKPAQLAEISPTAEVDPHVAASLVDHVSAFLKKSAGPNPS